MLLVRFEAYSWRVALIFGTVGLKKSPNFPKDFCLKILFTLAISSCIMFWTSKVWACEVKSCCGWDCG